MVEDAFAEDKEKPINRRSLKAPPLGDCQICLQKAHGIHFGVLACRACAAFFRRTVVLSRTYGCRRAAGNCDIARGERFICRQCRYKKCLRLGMTPENVQLNRDSLTNPVAEDEGNEKQANSDTTAESSVSINAAASTEDASTSQSADVETNNGSGKFSFGQPQTHPKTVLELYLEDGKARIIGQLETILKTFDVPKEVPLLDSCSALERMREGLQWCRREQNMQPEIVDSFSLEDCEDMFLENVLTTAQWFMFSEEFVKLRFEDKFSIFRATWATWPLVEKMDLSLTIFGDRYFNEKLVLITTQKAGFANKMKVDLTSITDHNPDTVRDMMNDVMFRIFDAVAKPIQEMKLSQLEITYMQCQLAFHVEGKAVSEAAQEACVRFRNRISNDLHKYYVEELQQPNYANKLIKIMGLINIIESIQSEKAKMLELASIFDVIKFNISEENFI